MEDGSESTLVVVPAREACLDGINALIGRSKAYWDWPAGYLEQALVLQRIDAEYLRGSHSFQILDGQNELVGFFAVAAGNNRIVLDNLWVTPERIGQGIGRKACEHVFQLARDHKWTALWVVPDPPAEGFYQRLGFVDTGERRPSRVPGGPLFSVYLLRL
jgi:GNAT superfamily N-acetyltransferase